jgi:hypothetical protein
VVEIYEHHFPATISAWRECMITLEPLEYCGESDEVVRFPTSLSLNDRPGVSALFVAFFSIFVSLPQYIQTLFIDCCHS